jgi:glutamine---fructose-6-phosphate transaminase (isomerizing)
MCGIVGVVQGEETWEVIPLARISEPLEHALRSMPDDVLASNLNTSVAATAKHLSVAELLLRGPRGALALAHDPGAIVVYEGQLDELSRRVGAIEAALDDGTLRPSSAQLEALNASIVELKDLLFRARNDSLRIARTAIELAGRDATPHAVALFAQIEVALSAIDRLEVRGRDSAGIAVLVREHRLDLSSERIRSLLSDRMTDELLPSGSVRVSNGNLCFIYKAAAEVGELGDNTHQIREAIVDDPLLHMALQQDSARAVVLGHTRWASVGMISEPNAHPVGSFDQPLIFAALNGDIDNHADITAAEGLEIPAGITTDAEIIPLIVSRRLSAGADLVSAFRGAVSEFQGSVAIAAISMDEPDKLLLALRGSGQALYVGLADGGFLAASEPYGVVEQATLYVRMDGEALSDPENPAARGQVMVVNEGTVRDISALHRLGFDGRRIPVTNDDVRLAEITTRDVDRGPYPHFLLKEMLESPRSFRLTLRGRLAGDGDDIKVELGPETFPDEIVHGLRTQALSRIVCIGQGSAAIAARSLAAVLADALRPAPMTVEGLAATELSGFRLRENMRDTLIVAISQSGTTADTNRTVEVARARGAYVIAVVNRRQSDLTDRAHGVLYTSDGRDVEMAVPSTKAFYAQIAAGFLLSSALADLVEGSTGVDPAVLAALRELPDAMEAVLGMRPQIAEIAQRHVPYRRDWAVVGNGANRIAAEEVRIKLSELCYKSISCDSTEDKKHIDLSAEPLILVCAAGLLDSNAEDVAKEVVYYRAHKAAPIVIYGEGEGRYDAALDVIRVPHVHPAVAFVLSTIAGHVFGYEAALAIDALADPMREARSTVEAATTDGPDPWRLLERVAPSLRPAASRFQEGLRAGMYDGHLEPSMAVQIASLFRYATGRSSLDAYQVEFGKVGTPGEVLRDLLGALTIGIDKLTRPVDAIRHQAKTVTVGISRAEETLLQTRLVREVFEAGVARDRLTYGSLRALAALDPAVERVAGYTLYRVEGDVTGEAFVHITDRGGIARDIPSRTDRDPRLRGTKHRVAFEREVLVTRGHDGRTLVIVPEVKGAETTGIALLHVAFRDFVPADVMRGVLQGYRDRYNALRDIVTETEPTFRDDLLGETPVADLLIDSIQALAQRWRTS